MCDDYVTQVHVENAMELNRRREADSEVAATIAELKKKVADLTTENERLRTANAGLRSQLDKYTSTVQQISRRAYDPDHVPYADDDDYR